MVKKKINNFLVENVKFIGSEFDFCFGEKIIGLGKMWLDYIFLEII